MGAFSGFASGLTSSLGNKSEKDSVDKFKDKLKSHHSSKMGPGAADIEDPASPQSAHKGAKIRKGGKIRVLKGERVLSKAQNKKYEKRIRRK